MRVSRGLSLIAAVAGLVLAGAVAAMVACSLRPVRVGAVLPLTGPYAVYGKSLERGAFLAAERVNASGGIEGRRIEILVRDSGSDDKAAAEAFQALVEKDQVSVVLGGCTTGETLAMAPLAERYRRVLLSPSASGPQITTAGDFVFRIWPSDELEGRTLADFAAYTLHATRALILAERNPYADGLREVFTRRFCAVQGSCATVLYDRGQPPGAVLDAAKEALAGSQVVFVAGYGADMVPLLAALRARAPKPPVLSVSAISEGALLKGAAAEFEGTVFARPAFDPEGGNPDAAEFASAYTSRYSAVGDVYAAHAYDAVRILAEVMSKGELGAEAIRKGLLAMRNFPGASGPTSFDPNGDVVQPYQICVVRGGRAVPLKTVMEQVLPLPPGTCRVPEVQKMSAGGAMGLQEFLELASLVAGLG